MVSTKRARVTKICTACKREGATIRGADRKMYHVGCVAPVLSFPTVVPGRPS